MSPKCLRKLIKQFFSSRFDMRVGKTAPIGFRFLSMLHGEVKSGVSPSKHYESHCDSLLGRDFAPCSLWAQQSATEIFGASLELKSSSTWLDSRFSTGEKSKSGRICWSCSCWLKREIQMKSIADLVVLLLFPCSFLGVTREYSCWLEICVVETLRILEGLEEDCVDYFGNIVSHGYHYVPGKVNSRILQ